MATPQRPQRPSRPQNPNQGQMQGGNQRNNPYNNMQGNNQDEFFGNDFSEEFASQRSNPQQRRNPQQQNYMSEEMYMQQMRQGKKKTLKVILIILGIIVFLVGEGFLAYYVATGRIAQRVPELEAEVADWEVRYEDLMDSKNNEIDNLKEAVNEMTVKEVIPTTSLQRIRGQYIQELWLIENDFIAPNSLNIPEVSDSVNDSCIQIGQKFLFRPSDRWEMVSQGTTWEFQHPQKIWGKIRALSYGNVEKYTFEDMQAVIQQFFVTEEAKYPNLTDIVYRKCFIDDSICGIIGRAEFPVYYTEDEEINYQILKGDGLVTNEYTEGLEIPENADISTKKMTINVGYFYKSEYAITFIFLYDSDGGSNSQELVELLLKSCTFGLEGPNLKLE